MISTTGWALRMWAKVTVALLLALGVVWLITGTGGWFWTTAAGGVFVEYWLIRQLAREWAWQARGTWWWAQ